MQPGVTVALATVWLAGATGVLSATFHPSYSSLDQYSPQLRSKQHEVTQGPQNHASWKLQAPSEDLTSKMDPTSNDHLPIEMSNLKSPRGTFLRYESPDRTYAIGPQQIDSHLSLQDSMDNMETQSENPRKIQKKLFDTKDFARQRDLFIAQQKKAAFQREDSDDYGSFQDQGPGSIETYRLDLFEEDSLYNQNQNFSKKKEDKLKEKYKFKSKEIKQDGLKEDQSIPFSYDLKKIFKPEKEVLSPEPNFSNQLEDSEDESFAVGGVPELQVGCEGVEASFRDKRSPSGSNINDGKDEELLFHPENIVDVQLVYESNEDEDPEGFFYEERDELIKLKKLEKELQNPLPHRGDIPIISQVDDDKKEKLPVRGDLASAFRQGEWDGLIHEKETSNSKEETYLSNGRKLLSISQSSFSKRRKRDSGDFDRKMWGYGEDEGVILDDELKADERRKEEARREDHMRIKQEEKRRKNHHHQGTEDRNRRDERERIMKEQNIRLKESEHMKQEEQKRMMRHDEKRRMQEEYRGKETYYRRNWPTDDKRQEEDRRREEEKRKFDQERRSEEARRRLEEERRHLERRNYEEERRYKEIKRHEERKRHEEAERQRYPNKNLTPSNLVRLDHYGPERREQEENDKKLRDYIQRNTPIVVDSRRDLEDSRRGVLKDRRHHYDSRHHGREREPVWLESKRAKESTRLFNISRLENLESRKIHRPLNDMGSKNRMDEIRRRPDVRRMEEEARRLDRERIMREEEEKRRADRRRIELAERRLEEEDRRRKSQRYEEDRIWHEKMRQQAERMRQEWMHEANRRSQADRKPVWNRYPPRRNENKGYQPPPSPPNFNNKGHIPPPNLNNKGYIPSPNLNNKGYIPPLDFNNKGYTPPPNLNNKGYTPPPDPKNKGYTPSVDLNNKGYQPSRLNTEFERDRQRLEQERRRMEAERQARIQTQNDRYQELRRRQDTVKSSDDYRRRQQKERLNALPVSATIIVRPGGSRTNSSSPLTFSREGFGREIDFPGISTNHKGIQAARFPTPATRRPLVKRPAPCIWAVVQCCPASDGIVSCFESLGCPSVNWNPNVCKSTIIQAAKNEIAKL